MTNAGSPLSSRSSVSIFVHNLHLLNLDQLEDWPGISLQSFGPKSNLQQRIRCIEWALYHLFELYDGRVTRDKLRPFFPPSTSLQSVNLRAALLRQLTELKKDGVLGQNVILRKTMLDECKGDKFEELLASFSVMVLRKTLKLQADDTKLAPVRNHHIVPLLLSYRKSIQRDLEKRKELGLRARQQQKNIAVSIEAVNAEAKALTLRKAPNLPENAELARKVVLENWIGEHAWVDAVFNGMPPQERHNSAPDDENLDSSSGLLCDLQSKIQVQNNRLAQWQGYLQALQQRKSPNLELPQPQKEQKDIQLTRFPNHRHLRGHAETPAWDEGHLNTQHDALLESLKRDLSAKPLKKQFLIANPAKPLQSTHAPKPLSTDLSTSSNQIDHIRQFASIHSPPLSSQEIFLDESDLPTPRATSAHGPLHFNRPDRFETMPLMEHGFVSGSPKASTPQEMAQTSLLERTRASLAHFDSPSVGPHRKRESIVRDQNMPTSTTNVSGQREKLESDRTSLLERTRQSMSMLTSVLEDGSSHPHHPRSKRPMHTRTNTAIHIPTQRRKLERAWSEESLASTATKESLDLDAEYENVFKSRPRLAMSPNLSPQRTGGDLWLESQLQDSMNKLTIDSSPEL